MHIWGFSPELSILTERFKKFKSLYHSYSFIEESNITLLCYHFPIISLSIIMYLFSLVNGKSFLLFPMFILIIAESLV